jgi:hypothetical protein
MTDLLDNSVHKRGFSPTSGLSNALRECIYVVFILPLTERCISFEPLSKLSLNDSFFYLIVIRSNYMKENSDQEGFNCTDCAAVNCRLKYNLHAYL